LGRRDPRQQYRGTVETCAVYQTLVLEHGGNEDQAIAALLHDAAEDQGGAERLDEIREKFGDTVAAIVSDCTDAWAEPKPEWRPRKEAYLAILPSKPTQSLLVSLADKTHNAEAILFDYSVLGDRFGNASMAVRTASIGITTGSLRCFRKRCPAS
jgi:(p)ppGpp synthase/HD superfamily hydrolase